MFNLNLFKIFVLETKNIFKQSIYLNGYDQLQQLVADVVAVCENPSSFYIEMITWSLHIDDVLDQPSEVSTSSIHYI